MSIMSSIIADASNEVKRHWVKKLDEAIEEDSMEKVKEITEEIRRYWFSE